MGLRNNSGGTKIIPDTDVTVFRFSVSLYRKNKKNMENKIEKKKVFVKIKGQSKHISK